MRRAFKYRLWTNANQERELSVMLETHRRLYNACLGQRKEAYESDKRTVKYTEQSAWFKLERLTNQFFARINFSSAQDTMRRLDKAFVAFFRRSKTGDKPGYPRFCSRDRYDSFTFPAYGDGVRLVGDQLRVQHIGMVRVKLHRPVEGTIKTVTLLREAGKWYACFSCEIPDMPLTVGKPAVGVDVGLSHFLTTSEGDKEKNPRYLKDALPKMRRVSRAVSRKKKGGKNRRKEVKRLTKLHARIKNLRKEHHHQVACRLVRRYGLIAVESLNIKGMLRNGRLSRAIVDAAWGGFLLTLKSKAEKVGSSFVEVNPNGTSQTCLCGCEIPKTLADRWHSCPSCGLSEDRDTVSAKLILARGLTARTEPVRANARQQPNRSARSRRVYATE